MPNAIDDTCTLPMSTISCSPHLKGVEGVGTLSARSLAGGDTQDLGGHADRALDLEGLFLGTADQISADYKQCKRSINNAGTTGYRSVVFFQLSASYPSPDS